MAALTALGDQQHVRYVDINPNWLPAEEGVVLSKEELQAKASAFWGEM
jgi:hypothetical protein